MAREEEEEEEAMSLTYDRPELVNKVVFRRSLTTGNWEVCPCDQASQNKMTTTSNKIHNSKVKNSHKNKVRKHTKASEEFPLPLTPDSTNTLSRITRSGLSGKSSNDPDYTPEPDVTTRKTRTSPRNTSISPNSESIKSKIKNCTLTTSNSENTLIHSTSTESISSRTRHRQSQSNTPVLVNHSNDNDTTARRQSLRRKH